LRPKLLLVGELRPIKKGSKRVIAYLRPTVSFYTT